MRCLLGERGERGTGGMGAATSRRTSASTSRCVLVRVLGGVGTGAPPAAERPAPGQAGKAAGVERLRACIAWSGWGHIAVYTMSSPPANITSPCIACVWPYWVAAVACSKPLWHM
jgi:hypothetical protein